MLTRDTLNAPNLMILAALGSVTLLLGAFGFQALGYAPCGLCVLQRWPHVFAALCGAGVLLIRHTSRTTLLRALGGLGMICALMAASIATYHLGVETGWWRGPNACSGTVHGLATMSAQELVARLNAAPIVRCDEVAWRFLGVSMAGWNAALSLGLAGIWGAGLARRAR